MRRGVAGLLLGLAACVSDAPVVTMGPAPLPPAWAKDQPDEMRGDLPVNYTQAKVGVAVAPELLVTSDGQAIRAARDWEMVRRPEIIKLLTDNQYGAATIKTAARAARAWIDDWESQVPALGDKALRTQTSISMETELGTHTIDVLLYTPANAKGPSPVVLMVNFSPNVVMVDDTGIRETDAWVNGQTVPGRQARAIAKQDLTPYLERGYGVALVYYGQIEPDFGGGASDGLRKIFKPANTYERAPNEAGAIATWAEGLSLVREQLAANDLVDGKRIALYGVSRLGKTALWAGATDPEFAAVVTVCSGEGGAALSRRVYGETIAHVAASFPYWFAPRWNELAANPAASPVDAHMTLAMIAPRPLLVISGETDAWADPYGEFLAARLATQVWRLFGKEGVDAAPELDTVTGGELSYLVHTGGHGPGPADTPAILDFLDRYMAAASR